MHTNYGDSRFSRFTDIIEPPTMPLLRSFVIRVLRLNMYTKFDNSSFSRSRHMVGTHKHLMVRVT